MFVKFSYGCKNIVFELNTTKRAVFNFFTPKIFVGALKKLDLRELIRALL